MMTIPAVIIVTLATLYAPSLLIALMVCGWVLIVAVYYAIKSLIRRG